MSTGRDDDALSWGGDDDPTLDVGVPVVAPEPLALPDGYTAVGRGSDEVGRAGDTRSAPDADTARDAEPVATDAAPMGNAMLVTLGIIAGAYLLYTIGWIVGGLRLEGTAQFLVSPAAYRFALWLAIAAPALWFGTVYLLTRASKAWLRIVWLVGGLALLIPWPFIMVGAVGQ